MVWECPPPSLTKEGPSESGASQSCFLELWLLPSGDAPYLGFWQVCPPWLINLPYLLRAIKVGALLCVTTAGREDFPGGQVSGRGHSQQLPSRRPQNNPESLSKRSHHVALTERSSLILPPPEEEAGSGPGIGEKGKELSLGSQKRSGVERLRFEGGSLLKVESLF